MTPLTPQQQEMVEKAAEAIKAVWREPDVWPPSEEQVAAQDAFAHRVALAALTASGLFEKLARAEEVIVETRRECDGHMRKMEAAVDAKVATLTTERDEARETGRKDFADMRRFQEQFISADQEVVFLRSERNTLREALKGRIKLHVEHAHVLRGLHARGESGVRALYEWHEEQIEWLRTALGGSNE